MGFNRRTFFTGLAALSSRAIAQEKKLKYRYGKGPLLDVPYAETPLAVVNAMLKLAGVKKGDVVYDLGAGDGRIVIAAAKQYGARSIGLEIEPSRIAEAEANIRKSNVAHLATIRKENFLTANLKDATVVTMYLMPVINMQLRPKLLALTPGTRIVSVNWGMGAWEPEKRLAVDGHNLFLWRVPAKPIKLTDAP